MHSSFCFLISCLMIFISLSLNQFSFILIFNFQDYLTWLNTPCLSLAFMTTLISFNFSGYLFINHFFVCFLFLPILICLCTSRLYSRPSVPSGRRHLLKITISVLPSLKPRPQFSRELRPHILNFFEFKILFSLTSIIILSITKEKKASK